LPATRSGRNRDRALIDGRAALIAAREPVRIAGRIGNRIVGYRTAGRGVMAAVRAHHLKSHDDVRKGHRVGGMTARNREIVPDLDSIARIDRQVSFH